MKGIRTIYSLIAIVVFTFAASSLAQAQSTRTWVSGVGDDVNPCSRTAPCKTFAGAISKTATNGEIDVIDPGAFGTMTAIKSVTVDGGGMFAGVLATNTTGFTVNLSTSAANDPVATVRLRRLSISGQGGCGASCGTRTGLRGVHVSNLNTRAVNVTLDDVIIDSFVNEGVLWANNIGGHLIVRNSLIRNNGTAGIRADSTTNTVFMTVDNTHTSLNVQEGVRIEDKVKATIINSVASDNGLNGYVAIATAAGTPNEMNINNSTAANNGQNGIFSVNAGSVIRVSDSEVTNNVTNGFAISGGQLCSNTRNHVTTPTQASNCAFADQ
jgi:hypothetical protein